MACYHTEVRLPELWLSHYTSEICGWECHIFDAPYHVRWTCLGNLLVLHQLQAALLLYLPGVIDLWSA